MSQTKEFIDCPHCHKRVLSTARRCHRCQANLLETGSLQLADDQAHMAVEGGYDDDETYSEQDYRDFVESEWGGATSTRRRKPWVWLTCVALLLFFLYLSISSFLAAWQ